MNHWPFWIVIFIILAVTASMIALGLHRGSSDHEHPHEKAHRKLRKAQIQEIEHDLERGEIDQAQAQSMKIEAERAYARATRRGEEATTSEGPKWGIWAAFGMAALASIVVYSQFGIAGFPDMPLHTRQELMRPSQARAYEILRQEGQIMNPAVDPESKALIEELEESLQTQAEDDPRGWSILARSAYSVGQYKRAYEAQNRYIEMIGEAATSDDYALLAESMILAVNQYISPEAEAALRQSLQINPETKVARYYAGLAMIQEGETANGRLILENLLLDVADDPNWQDEIKQRLAESQASAGPSAQEIENAANMSAKKREQMIGGMVDGLKTRLASKGGTPEEWARLVNALRVLDRNEEAKAILGEAKQKFPNDPAIRALE